MPPGRLDKSSPEKIVDALIHLYRGEVQRVNTWRTRLDATPHWAIVMAAGVITWTFSSPSRVPSLILLAIPLVSALMVLESHRFQMHEIWRSRLRFLEENFFAYFLRPEESPPREDWMDVLAEDLRVPEHKGTLVHSISVRLRRIYFWLILTLCFAWMLKLNLHPTQAGSFKTIMTRARVGVIPGIWTVGAVAALLIFLISWVVWGMWLEREEREGEIPDEEPGYEWRREQEKESEENE